MIKRYTEKEFNETKWEDKLRLECEYCHKIFLKRKSTVIETIKKSWYKRKYKDTYKYYSYKCKYCSKECTSNALYTSPLVECKQCGKIFKKKTCECKKHPNHFCSSSCAATYNNTHKTTGYRRSKIEIWIEKQLSKIYPKMKILFNCKKIINSELDIYVPKLKLAIEINGIFHYKPIYGKEQFKKIKANDKRKIKSCKNNKIKLIIIDVSSFKHFYKKVAQPYLEKIIDTIEKRKRRLKGVRKRFKHRKK